MAKKQEDLKNESVRSYSFLKEMYEDSYFPSNLVDKGKAILVDLCFKIEQEQPESLDELYELTHAATDKFNDLQEEFLDGESEIETGARECIAADFDFIAKSYDFEADGEELIATREW
ncbi:hypothetical protein J0X19_01800 [Hymenobacter sp. BT186]|uniref:Uncharacterized protein n=1 Tax=Hymenobacter telluris TaxID=2816474 RepID=A0A939JBD1_9BACT|nr:DUF5713 family protein [Hymenobacter telluris]MBO0356668.1 hypothetical protein [Hymenobacter telluris]MBW3372693.1 hypothetical protein [Hymenobacter norwichensis]